VPKTPSKTVAKTRKKRPTDRATEVRASSRARSAPTDASADWGRVRLAAGPVDPEARAAFTAQFDDGECLALGAKTDAEAVLADAKRWCVIIEEAIRAHQSALRRYGPERLAFLVECVRALELAIVEQKASEDDEGAAMLVDLQRVAAIATRGELYATLRTLAGGRSEERVRLEHCIAPTSDDDALVDELDGLAALAGDWIERPDPHAMVLVRSVALRREDAEAARSAARALEDARKARDRALAPAGRRRDRPETDLIEGRVLVELRVARDAFDAARALHPGVPALRPSAATRVVLGAPETVSPRRRAR
jgi:hypothetical protein